MLIVKPDERMLWRARMRFLAGALPADLERKALSGQLGSGFKIGFASGSPQVWTKVTQLMTLGSVPGVERDEVETTTSGVTTLRKFIPGLGTVAPLEFSVLADFDVSSVHMQIKDLEVSQATRWWRLEIPNTSDLATTNFMAFQFEGKVKTWLPQVPIDGAKTIDIAVLFADNLMVQQTMASVLG